MHRISKLRSFLGAFACVAALAGLGALPASAELAQWDQTRVTELAKQLAAAGEAWELAVRQQPGADQVGSGDAQEGFGLLENARVLREMSQGLAGNLSAGKGYDKTVDMYKSLKEKVDDSDVDAQRMELDEPTMAAWSKFADALRQIAPYYDPKANADPSK